MRKSYILVFDKAAGTRNELTDVLTAMPEVVDWRAELPYAVFLVSESSANDLVKAIRSERPKGRIAVMEIGPNKQGWLSPEAWYLVNNKRRKPGPK